MVAVALTVALVLVVVNVGLTVYAVTHDHVVTTESRVDTAARQAAQLALAQAREQRANSLAGCERGNARSATDRVLIAVQLDDPNTSADEVLRLENRLEFSGYTNCENAYPPVLEPPGVSEP